MRRRRRTLLVALAAVVLAGCGSGEAASPSGSPSTVGNVGHLPGELSHGTSPAPAPSTTTGSNAAATPTTTSSATGGTDGPSAAPSASVPGHIGDLTDGDHLFILGDSILEATTPEYGGLMCSSLLPHGWTVETDAQTGRDAAGGLQALEDRIDQGEQWDASIVMLGNNYRDDPDQFDEQLGEILDLLSPDPVLLLTVTEFEDIQAQVNEVIRTEAAKRDNVRLLDWAARTANDDSLVGDDGLHLTDKGRVAIVAMIRLALGDAPIGSLGQCRDS